VVIWLFLWVSFLLPLSRRAASDATVTGDTLSHLTRKHGIKITGDFPCSMEDIEKAVGEKVGHGSVKSAARMNGAVVIFLDQVEKVSRVLEAGLTVGTGVPQLESSCPTSLRLSLTSSSAGSSPNTRSWSPKSGRSCRGLRTSC